MAEGPGIRLPPPLIYLAAFLAGLGLEFVAPTPDLPLAVAVAVGVAAVAVWILLDPGAMWQFRSAGTEVAPSRPSTSLVSKGPYRFSRNPMYLGMLVLLGGLGLAFGLLWALALVPVVFLIVDRFIVPREEDYLERKFGDDYRAFRRRVRRCL